MESSFENFIHVLFRFVLSGKTNLFPRFPLKQKKRFYVVLPGWHFVTNFELCSGKSITNWRGYWFGTFGDYNSLRFVKTKSLKVTSSWDENLEGEKVVARYCTVSSASTFHFPHSAIMGMLEREQFHNFFPSFFFFFFFSLVLLHLYHPCTHEPTKQHRHHHRHEERKSGEKGCGCRGYGWLC